MRSLTLELALKHFAYSPETGVLVWKEPRAPRVKVGDLAGGLTGQGYREVKFGDHTYGTHRIAWLMATGSWPNGQIDHINGVRNDNRLCNLREVSIQGNAQNQRHARQDNRHSSLIGAAFHKATGKFRARIGMPDGKQKHLGSFATAEEAHAVYVAAKRQMHAACTI